MSNILEEIKIILEIAQKNNKVKDNYEISISDDVLLVSTEYSILLSIFIGGGMFHVTTGYDLKPRIMYDSKDVIEFCYSYLKRTEVVN